MYNKIDSRLTFDNVVLGPANKTKVFDKITSEVKDVCKAEPEEDAAPHIKKNWSECAMAVEAKYVDNETWQFNQKDFSWAVDCLDAAFET